MGKQVAWHVRAIYKYKPIDEDHQMMRNNLASSRVWRMKACKGRRSTDAWSYSEEKLITGLRKYIGAFSRYMSYFPLPYYLSKYRQGKYTPKASKVQERILNCLGKNSCLSILWYRHWQEKYLRSWLRQHEKLASTNSMWHTPKSST